MIESMIEIYQLQKEMSKILSEAFMKFLSVILGDFNDVYFKIISGVRLNPLLEFILIDQKDYNIVNTYANFLNAIG
jgi:hypothetical protein